MVGWGLWGLGAVAWLWAGGQGAAVVVQAPPAAEPLVRFTSAPASELRARESRLQPQGDPSWRKGRPASSEQLQVNPSTQAARAGEHITVEISASEASVVRAEVFRLGVYGGTGAAKVWSSEPFTVATLPRCSSPACPARHSFSFRVAQDWVPGLYLVKVTRADGLRSFTSLVVKEPPPEEPRS